MKNCELCKTRARTFCESDQASLCLDCDAKVHGANFLVARHSRTLLCYSCQCPTFWNASGEKLENAFSFCQTCNVSWRGEESETAKDGDVGTDDEVNEEDSDDEFDDYDVLSDKEDEDVDGDDEDGDNQVVPFSTTSSPPQPESSYSSDQSGYRFGNNDGDVSGSLSNLPFKRMRENASDLIPQTDVGLSRYGSELINEVAVESRSGGESWRPFEGQITGPGRTRFKSQYGTKLVVNFKEGERNSDNLDEDGRNRSCLEKK